MRAYVGQTWSNIDTLFMGVSTQLLHAHVGAERISMNL